MTSAVSCGFARVGGGGRRARACYMIQQLVQRQLNQTERLLFCYFLCTGVGRVQVEGWARVEKTPQSSLLFGLFRYFHIVVSSARRPERSRKNSHIEGCRSRVLSPLPVAFVSLFWAFVSAPLRSSGEEFSLLCIRRNTSGPDVQLVPFDLSSADISAFECWMLRLPGR